MWSRCWVAQCVVSAVLPAPRRLNSTTRPEWSGSRWLSSSRRRSGAELLNARKKAKVSQKEASKAAGCSHVTVSYMEAGTTVQEAGRITKLMSATAPTSPTSTTQASLLAILRFRLTGVRVVPLSGTRR
jgi:DNA-binding XRE family transcriptional regulator